MRWIDLLVLAVSLSMDALAVSLAVGVAVCRAKGWQPWRLGISFGAFQSTTVSVGWLTGIAVRREFAAWAAWVAFACLLVLGGRAVFEAVRNGEDSETSSDPTRGWRLLTLSFATSIDGLVAGLPLAVLGIPVWWPAVVIGAVVSVLTIAGVYVGGRVGRAWRRRAGIAGGVGLWAVGTKILVVYMLAR